MTNPILGYDIDRQPLRAGDRVVVMGTKKKADQHLIGLETNICGPSIWYDDCVRTEIKEDGVICCFLPEMLRKLPPKQDHELGSWEEIAKMGWNPNLAPSTADC